MMLTAFTAGLLLITISELGDKTFCIAMMLAMRHSRRLVFIGVMAALTAMTVLSILMGRVVSVLPQRYLWYAEIILFIGFGLKLLYDAYHLPACPACDDLIEAKETVEQADLMPSQISPYAIVGQSFLLTFVAEWGDRTQFATITLAASSNHPFGITIGAILGHGICAAIAVMGGRLIAARISERVVTALGGLLFIIFGVVAAAQGR